jgi:hypothetical protein
MCLNVFINIVVGISPSHSHCNFFVMHTGASMVKWTTLDPCEGLTMQGSKLFIKFSFFEILFYKMLRNMLIYKVQ